MHPGGDWNPWEGVSNSKLKVYYPYLGKWSNLTFIFFRWVGEKPPTSCNHRLFAQGMEAWQVLAHVLGMIAYGNLTRWNNGTALAGQKGIGKVPSQSLKWNLQMAPWNRMETISFEFHFQLGQCICRNTTGTGTCLFDPFLVIQDVAMIKSNLLIVLPRVSQSFLAHFFRPNVF